MELNAKKKTAPLLKEIAQRIDVHLKRLEADLEWSRPAGRPIRLFGSGAVVSGNRIGCTYVSYQSTRMVAKADAIVYLKALDGGFKGRHLEAMVLAEKERAQEAGLVISPVAKSRPVLGTKP